MGLCEICKVSKYNYECPNCKIKYCSLTCYKNPTEHLSCSEKFYQSQVLSSLSADKHFGSSPFARLSVPKASIESDIDYSVPDLQLSDDGMLALASCEAESVSELELFSRLSSADQLKFVRWCDKLAQVPDLFNSVFSDLQTSWDPWWEQAAVLALDDIAGIEPAPMVPATTDLAFEILDRVVPLVFSYCLVARQFNGVLSDEPNCIEFVRRIGLQTAKSDKLKNRYVDATNQLFTVHRGADSNTLIQLWQDCIRILDFHGVAGLKRCLNELRALFEKKGDCDIVNNYLSIVSDKYWVRDCKLWKQRVVKFLEQQVSLMSYSNLSC